MDTLDFIRNGGETRRYHTQPVLRHQTVMEHSGHVAMLAAWLAAERGGTPTSALLMAALTHDLAEHKTGDMPSPAKRAIPGLKAQWDELEAGHLDGVGLAWDHLLTEQEARWLKVADNADGCLYCIRERAMGNKLITFVYENFRDYLSEVVRCEEGGREFELLMYIDREWGRAND